MKLDVPYFSIKSSKKLRTKKIDTRGIACTKMFLEFYGLDNRLEDMLAIGGTIGLCDTPYNFMLDSLVVFLKMNGFNVHKEYFRNTEIDFVLSSAVQTMYDEEYRERGILYIAQSIHAKLPVFASVSSVADKSADDDLILLFGYDKRDGHIKGFYYHDSEHENQFIGIDDFRKRWTRTAVFAE
jgi:hypothetical protein